MNAVTGEETKAAFWLQLFILSSIVCQLALLVESLGGLRILFRGLAFSGSLGLLVLLTGRAREHPSRRWAIAILAIVSVGLLHPSTNTLLAGLAQIMLYVAILGPVFWVSRLGVSSRVFDRVVLILWGFHSLSAAVGVLQVYFPGRFQPKVSDVVLGKGKEWADSFKITLANGEEVYRPMGLTDMPGGAASAGLYAFLFGLGFFLRSKSAFVKGLSIWGIALGFFCIYLSQVRSVLVMGVICGITFVAILFRRGEVGRSVVILTLLAAALIGAFSWAVMVGGEDTSSRVNTLFEDSAGKIYYKNRGHFLEDTFDKSIYEYPMGAGLARWGMMRRYFGDPWNQDSPSLWVEIQWTGWLFDGGVLLMGCYTVAILLAMWAAYRVAMSDLPGGLPVWGALVLAYDVGALALTFNYPLFIGQGGMEFWLLNAALWAAAVRVRVRPRVPAVERKRHTTANRVVRAKQPAGAT